MIPILHFSFARFFYICIMEHCANSGIDFTNINYLKFAHVSMEMDCQSNFQSSNPLVILIKQISKC